MRCCRSACILASPSHECRRNKIGTDDVAEEERPALRPLESMEREVHECLRDFKRSRRAHSSPDGIPDIALTFVNREMPEDMMRRSAEEDIMVSCQCEVEEGAGRVAAIDTGRSHAH